MYKITAEESFDSAHFLKDYDGKCANIHGHRWRVLVTAGAEELSEKTQTRGMVLDFGDLKKALREETEALDHLFIIEKDSLRPETKEVLLAEGFRIREVSFRPTAENFSRYFFDRIRRQGYPVLEVTVFETPNNRASYSPSSEISGISGGMSGTTHDRPDGADRNDSAVTAENKR